MKSPRGSESVLGLRMICSMFVFDAKDTKTGAELGRSAENAAGISAYFTEHKDKISVPPVLPYFIYSEKLNYKPEFIRNSTAFWAALPDVSVEYPEPGKEKHHADVVLHGYTMGMVVAYIMFPAPLSAEGADEVISAEMGGVQAHFSWRGCAGTSVDEFAGELLAFLFGKTGLVSPSFGIYYVSLNGKSIEEMKADPGAMYGIIDADWSFRKVKPEIAARVVGNDVSMVDGVALYFMKERGVVFYGGKPSEYIEGITGYCTGEFAGVLQHLCDEENLAADFSEGGINRYAPFVDYAVELDTLRVQEALLRKYNDMLKVGHKYRKEMITIKNSVSSGMDIYYAINSATIEGVRYAIESAKREMRIDDSLSLVYKKMELVADSLATRYDIENNTWNSVFAMLVAIFGFGTLIAAFVFHFLPGLPVAYSLTIVFSLTAIITVIVVIIARVNIENRTRGT